MTPALPREERAAEVLREHQHKRFCWECTCDGQHTYQGDLRDVAEAYGVSRSRICQLRKGC